MLSEGPVSPPPPPPPLVGRPVPSAPPPPPPGAGGADGGVLAPQKWLSASGVAPSARLYASESFTHPPVRRISACE